MVSALDKWQILRHVTVLLLLTAHTSWATPLDSTTPFDLSIAPSNLTMLADAGVSCATGQEPTHKEPIAAETCLLALKQTFGESPPNLMYTKRWGTSTYHASGGQSADITVPKVWESSKRAQQAGKCYMLVSSMKKGSRGVVGADAADFSLLGAVYYASLVIGNCVRTQKTSFGGRFTIKQNSFYVDVTGTDPTRLSESQDWIQNTTAIFQA